MQQSSADTIDAGPGQSAGGDRGAAHGAGHDEALPAGFALGPYRLVQILGQGGMGHVYLAEHALIGRRVAVKVLRPSMAAQTLTVERFFAEARAANSVRHPGIVEVTDLITEGGHSAIVMELLDGQSLAAIVSAGPLPPRRALAIAANVADTLAAAHRAGIIHRDIKPENLMVVDDNATIKVLDFGVAKFSGPRSGRSTETMAGAIVGTPAFMAPEQLAGRDVDERVDIYSLGCVLYFMLSGELPFTADSFGDWVVQHLTMPPRPLKALAPHLGDDVVRLVMELLEKDPSKRPATMVAVKGRLNELEAAMTTTTALPTARARFSTVETISHGGAVADVADVSRRRRAAAVVLTLAVVAVAVGALFLSPTPPEPSPALAADPRPAPADIIAADFVPDVADVPDVAAGTVHAGDDAADVQPVPVAPPPPVGSQSSPRPKTPPKATTVRPTRPPRPATPAPPPRGPSRTGVLDPFGDG
jgi:tRNA A-37 threonylcarbamoyl transferase component Bud32